MRFNDKIISIEHTSEGKVIIQVRAKQYKFSSMIKAFDFVESNSRVELAKELKEILKRSLKEGVIVFNEFNRLKEKLESEIK